MSKKRKTCAAPKSLRDDAAEALRRATNARLVVRTGPKTVRYTITYSVPREP
jgi:hypothetical protein